MKADYETTDPLQLLMAEWKETNWWFFGLLATALFARVTIPTLPELSLLLAAFALGLVLLKLGTSLLVIANELRKELRGSRWSQSGEDQESHL